MNRRLHARLAFIIIATATCILFISTVSVIVATHYHISMFHEQAAGMSQDISRLEYHLEQALVQSIVWTFAGSLLLAVLIGLYIAKRISRPLVGMKQVAEKMSDGQLDARVSIAGKDELAELGASLNDLAEQLQKQEQLRVTMTEDIAHELRTPLATLKSHMRAFEDGIWEPTPERIHSCYEEIERLANLVAELEDLTHVESPAFRLERQEHSLASIIEQGTGLLAAAYMEKKVGLSFRCSPDIRLFADRSRMIQILVNLLSNALRFTPVNGTVRIEAVEERQSVLIAIRDSGSGIAREDLPYIFERFYRGDKSRNRRTGGSGLGLTIVKRLVTAHGGQIWAESNPGTTFCIRLPGSGSIVPHSATATADSYEAGP
ncbi:HAMP domain-containing protein [Paenibacillus mesophilus]|uniref:sensor histidine kinase n=1 Tax=Paenibacillus mesophilus TaxID=2582849 RepID=UPI00110E8D7F|nr:ATP-binding protein [Paenibacillus mesophilus]TMV43989.1 HAMP domain-containing protein [Paenibacillus mesophilus]